jgi:hypothetical protein
MARGCRARRSDGEVILGRGEPPEYDDTESSQQSTKL